MDAPYSLIHIYKVKNISNIEELNSIENIRLIYPKETNVDESENSALYPISLLLHPVTKKANEIRLIVNTFLMFII